MMPWSLHNISVQDFVLKQSRLARASLIWKFKKPPHVIVWASACCCSCRNARGGSIFTSKVCFHALNAERCLLLSLQNMLYPLSNPFDLSNASNGADVIHSSWFIPDKDLDIWRKAQIIIVSVTFMFCVSFLFVSSLCLPEDLKISDLVHWWHTFVDKSRWK